MKKYLFVILGLAFFLSACSKYEDGPALSLKTKNSRLKGFWVERIEEGNLYIYTYDGHYYIDYHNYGSPIDTIVKRVYYDIYYFRDNNNLSKLTLSVYYDIDISRNRIGFNVPVEIKGVDTVFYADSSNGFCVCDTGDWEWIDGKESLSLTFGEKSEKWDILRLTDDELVVEEDPSGKIELRKIKFKNEKELKEIFDL